MMPTEAPTVASMDRVYWVTVLRPQLIASGNLIETPAMKEEADKIRRQIARDSKKQPAVLTPAGDWVPSEQPDDGGEVPF